MSFKLYYVVKRHERLWIPNKYIIIIIIRRDMQELRITLQDAQDITFWKSKIRAADPT